MSSLLLIKSMLFANTVQKTEKTKKGKIKKVSSKKSKKIDLTMCRVCYSEKGDIPVFSNFIQPNIPYDIEIFTGVSMSKSDTLPLHMCQSCLDLLNGCIMFRSMCQHTNKLLLELSIKQEYCDIDGKTEKREASDFNIDGKADKQEASDIDYNVLSPACSEKSIGHPEVWHCSECKDDFYEIDTYHNHLPECKKRPQVRKPRGSQVFGKKITFLCDTCGKTARSRASLAAHMGIHEKVFPFKCDQCPYKGRTMDLLKVHKRSHLLDKPFKCTQCPKATTTSSNLAKHMRHVHSTTRPFKCTYCDKAFSYQHDMKRHVKDIHLRQGTVECDVCYKKFNTKKILQGHRWKIHKIKGERQGRLPSYLQHQGPQAIETDNDDNMECDGNY